VFITLKFHESLKNLNSSSILIVFFDEQLSGQEAPSSKCSEFSISIFGYHAKKFMLESFVDSSRQESKQIL
jgi:hypothetical protein